MRRLCFCLNLMPEINRDDYTDFFAVSIRDILHVCFSWHLYSR